MIAHTLIVDGKRVEVRSTARADGDFAVLAPGTRGGDPRAEQLQRLRRAIVDRPWTWLHQTHDTVVVEVEAPGQWAGVSADGALTDVVGAPIAVTTADCSPLVLITTRDVAVLHVGWKGALAGIVEQAGAQLLARGGTPSHAILGPCISAAAYEFGAADLEAMADRYGDSVRAETVEGSPALDMVAVIGRACRSLGWEAPPAPACTSDPVWYSHRTRADRGRQTTVAWIAER